MIIDTTRAPVYYNSYNAELLKTSLKTLSQATDDLPNPTMFCSPSTGFRARAEFIFKMINKKPAFTMTLEDPITKQKSAQPIEFFADGHPFISTSMNALKSLLPNYLRVIHKLFATEFLVSTIGEVLITLIYHKKLDSTWEKDALELQDELHKLHPELNFGIIGRAKNQKVVLAKDYVYEQFNVNNRSYKMMHVENSFTQPNYYTNTNMLNWACENSKEFGGDLLELYCGNGNFSIPLSQNFRQVLATEISATSVESAQINLRNNHITNTKIIRLSAEEFTQAINKEREFKRLKHANVNLDAYDIKAVLVDPPRAGLDPDTLKLIARFDNIIYISCGIDSLATNLKELLQTHSLVKLAFFDQFPYTGHVETGCILTKK